MKRSNIIISEGWSQIRHLVNGQMEFISEDSIQLFDTQREAELDLVDHYQHIFEEFKNGNLDSLDLDIQVVFTQEFEDGHFEAFDEDSNMIYSWTPENKEEEKKTFVVTAKTITYCELEVKAKSKEEALEIAHNSDGGDFTDTKEGEWDIISVKVKEG